ncbi:hypothetical protein Ctob_007618 [Chrysochromulina tobinii]|uniref:Uncharacterized protein n=1 Tax=Chrysochromulina tobinii TaxID=1460289 RepID=A0A0M0JF49_9EUKA|nr:hypothetical protein Ctob_007618 [Chrysochromulina tobinii]|eukprot:KOO25219.1 hypothetical protein Ctob_007618 [Chrysochromulina sp. CCMP291]
MAALITDQNQLRLPEHTAGGLKGRLVALWIEEDAQFMLKRFDEFHEQLTEPVVKAPTAAGCRTDRGHQPTEVLVSLTAWAVAEDGDGYVLDDKTDVLYAHQLHACPTVAWGSDREACVRTGLAIDLNGDALRVCRPWHDVSVQVNAQSAPFQRQVLELLGCLFVTEARPELPTYVLSTDDI